MFLFRSLCTWWVSPAEAACSLCSTAVRPRVNNKGLNMSVFLGQSGRERRYYTSGCRAFICELKLGTFPVCDATPLPCNYMWVSRRGNSQQTWNTAEVCLCVCGLQRALGQVRASRRFCWNFIWCQKTKALGAQIRSVQKLRVFIGVSRNIVRKSSCGMKSACSYWGCLFYANDAKVGSDT